MMTLNIKQSFQTQLKTSSILTKSGSFVLPAIMAATFSTSGAQASSLEDAVRAALLTNPEVGIVAEDRRAVQSQLDQAKGGYLPTIDLNLAGGFGTLSDPASRARETAEIEDSEWVSMPRYESGLTLRQMIFDGFATDAAVERQGSRVVSASRRVRETSEFVAINAIEAYLEALRQQELTDLAKVNVKQHADHLEVTRRKVDGGAATVADIQQAQSRLATAESTLVSAQTRLRDSFATYTRIIGEEPEALSRPSAPEWALPGNLETAVGQAMTNNPSVSVAKADVDTALSEYRATQTGFLPNVGLKLEGIANRNVDGVRGGDYDASAMVEVSYNLFNGNRDVNLRHEFTARIGEARQRHNRALRFAEEEMRLAWNAMLSARDSSVVQRNEVDANARVRDTYGQQFDLGSRSLLELLDSENELFLASGNLTTTEYLNIFSVYRVLSTSGLLMSTLDVANIEEANTDLDPVEFLETDMSKYVAPTEQPKEIDLDKFEDDEMLSPEGSVLDPNASSSLDISTDNTVKAAAVEVTAPVMETASVVEPTPVPAVEAAAIIEAAPVAAPVAAAPAPAVTAEVAPMAEEIVPTISEANVGGDFNNLFEQDMAPVDNILSPLSMNNTVDVNG